MQSDDRQVDESSLVKNTEGLYICAILHMLCKIRNKLSSCAILHCVTGC